MIFVMLEQIIPHQPVIFTVIVLTDLNFNSNPPLRGPLVPARAAIPEAVLPFA
jgi:hypothetical protein